MKVVLWVVVAGVAFCLESLALMWVMYNVHEWCAAVPTMDFSSAFSVSVALSCALSVWKLAEKLIPEVNEL